MNLPVYPGGKKAFNTFIKENLKYPEEALQKGIEGDVLVIYEVNDNGTLFNPRIKHGIGYGCDEEALRLVGLLKYGKVSNRGLRVKSSFTTRIPFRISRRKSTSISYHFTVKKKEEKKPEEPKRSGYTWQIPLKTGNMNDNH